MIVYAPVTTSAVVFTPADRPSINKVTVLPASAIPSIVGVVLEVDEVVVEITGAAGGIVSTVRVIVLEAISFSFPAASLNAEAETLITPLSVLLSVGVNVAV